MKFHYRNSSTARDVGIRYEPDKLCHVQFITSFEKKHELWGFYFDPLTKNLENFLEDIQKRVTGKVTVLLTSGKVEAVAVDSKKILVSKDAVYAQSASWGVEESAGFIKLLGKSTSTWTEINKK